MTCQLHDLFDFLRLMMTLQSAIHCKNGFIHEPLLASQQFSRRSPIKRNLPPASKYIRKICSKMITSIIRYHTAIMSITRDRFRPYWVSSGGCKKHSIINMLKKTNLPLGAKKEKWNTKQYDTAIPISWGSHSRTHTHDMDNKSHR